MINLGVRTDCPGTDTLRGLGPVQQLQAFDGFDCEARPIAFPELISDDDVLICGYDQGRGECMIVCESFDDMQRLYAGCESGAVLNIAWYVGSRAELILAADGDHDLTTPEGVVAYMGESKSEDDWNARRTEVKAANGGDYPEFWFEEVISVGLFGKTEQSWVTNLDSLDCG